MVFRRASTPEPARVRKSEAQHGEATGQELLLQLQFHDAVADAELLDLFARAQPARRTRRGRARAFEIICNGVQFSLETCDSSAMQLIVCEWEAKEHEPEEQECNVAHCQLL